MSQPQQNKKKVLIIAYYFPPLGMGGVQRVSKFDKYLPSFGWQPVVLTVKDIEYFSTDDLLLQEISPAAKIYRAGSFDPLRCLYLIKNLFKGSKPEGDPERVALRNTKGRKNDRFFARQRRAQNDAAPFSYPRSRGFRPLRRFADLFLFPDNKIGWFPFALIKGIKICRKEKVELLFSTSPPLTCHLVGFFLKNLTGIRWVADYRDSYISYQDTKKPDSIKNRLLKNLQESFLKRADGVVSVNRTIAQQLNETGAESPRIEVITNGYDREDFVVKFEKTEDIFTIIYFGTFSADCPAEPFLKALSNLLYQGKIDQDKIRFVHVGLSIGINMEKEIEEYGLKEVAELKGYLSHKKGIEELLKADLALVTVSRSAPVISTGKIYEYFGAKIPILAIAPSDGEAAQLIQSLDAGRVVSPANIPETEEAILSFYRDFSNGSLISKTNADIAGKFERKYLTSRLAKLFDDISRRE